MALPNKFIVFLGRTFSGHNHDYSMLKQEFPPELDWFIDLNVRVDLGYLGELVTSFSKLINTLKYNEKMRFLVASTPLDHPSKTRRDHGHFVLLAATGWHAFF